MRIVRTTSLRKWLAGLGLAWLLLLACSPNPEPIEYNQDLCAYCQMVISDRRFGAELVTRKGKIYKYDSVECLAADVLKGKVPQEEIHSLWVVDFQQPGTLIDARTAYYLHAKQLPSPMGLNLSAFREETMVKNVQNMFPGEILDWNAVLELVRTAWLAKD